MRTTYMGSKEIAKYIRDRLKEEIPECKFSVVKSDFSGGRSIRIGLVEAPTEITNGGEGYVGCVNHYYLERDPQLNEVGKDIFMRVNNVVKEIHWDDSDPMTDYFSCNFYYGLHIGGPEKPFRVR